MLIVLVVVENYIKIVVVSKNNLGEKMFLIYEVLMPIIAIILSLIIIIALICVPKFRAGFFTKLGFYKTSLNFEINRDIRRDSFSAIGKSPHT